MNVTVCLAVNASYSPQTTTFEAGCEFEILYSPVQRGQQLPLTFWITEKVKMLRC